MGRRDDAKDDEANAMNISLPEAERRHVEERVASGRYPSPSDYIAELIRRDQCAPARAELEQALLEGQESGPARAFDEGFFERQRERIRRASLDGSESS